VAWQGFWASLQPGRPLASAFASTRGKGHEHAGPEPCWPDGTGVDGRRVHGMAGGVGLGHSGPRRHVAPCFTCRRRPQPFNCAGGAKRLRGHLFRDEVSSPRTPASFCTWCLSNLSETCRQLRRHCKAVGHACGPADRWPQRKAAACGTRVTGEADPEPFWLRGTELDGSLGSYRVNEGGTGPLRHGTGHCVHLPAAAEVGQRGSGSLPFLGAQGLHAQELLSVAGWPESFPDAQVLPAATDASAGGHCLQLVVLLQYLPLACLVGFSHVVHNRAIRPCTIQRDLF